MTNHKHELTVSPLHGDDRNRPYVHLSYSPQGGGEMQFIAIPKEKVHDVVLALLNTTDALDTVRSIDTAVHWEDLEDKS